MSQRVALVSGAASGIGRAIAAELDDRGWAVLGVGAPASTSVRSALKSMSLTLPAWPALFDKPSSNSARSRLPFLLRVITP